MEPGPPEVADEQGNEVVEENMENETPIESVEEEKEKVGEEGEDDTVEPISQVEENDSENIVENEESEENKTQEDENEEGVEPEAVNENDDVDVEKVTEGEEQKEKEGEEEVEAVADEGEELKEKEEGEEDEKPSEEPSKEDAVEGSGENEEEGLERVPSVFDELDDVEDDEAEAVGVKDDQEDLTDLSDFSDDEATKRAKLEEYDVLLNNDEEKEVKEEEKEESSSELPPSRRMRKRDSLMGDFEIEAAINSQKEQDEQERKTMEQHLQKAFNSSSFGDIVGEGWMTFKEEGLLKKKKRRFFRLYGKNNVMKYSREENLNVEGQVPIDYVDIEVLPGKKFFTMHTMKKEKTKKLTFWCPTREECEEWASKIQDFCKFPYHLAYDEGKRKEIGLKIKKILLEFQKAGKVDEAVLACKDLRLEYPRSDDVILTLAHFQSKILPKKKGIMMAMNTLRRELVFNFEAKSEFLTSEVKKKQFKFNFRLGVLSMKLYYESGNANHAQTSRRHLERCRLIYEKDEENLEYLACTYDELKMFDEGSLIWAHLVKLHPRDRIFIQRHIADLKRTHQWERLLYFLLSENKKKTEYPIIYSTLADLVTIKSLRRFYLRKFRFYTWLPDGMSHLKFSEAKYKDFLQFVVKLAIPKNTTEDTIPFKTYLDKSTLETTEFLLAFLCYLDKLPLAKVDKEQKIVCEVVLGELENRMFRKYNEALLDTVVHYFKNVFRGNYVTSKVAMTIFKNYSDLLKEKNKYNSLVTAAQTVYLQKKYTKILDVFVELGETLMFDPVMHVAMNEDEMKLGYRLHAILTLTKFCKSDKEKQDVLVKKYREKLKDDETTLPASKVAYFLVLYKLEKDRKDFNFMESLKVKKELPTFVSDYARKIEKGDEVFQDWVEFHKFRDKNKGCKVM